MKLFIENHIKRRLNLLDLLYFEQDVLSIHKLSNILSVSEVTVKSDLTYLGFSSAGDLQSVKLNKSMRMVLHNRIMSDSLMNRILDILLREPGKRANYYSDTLSISRINFYKQITILNGMFKPMKVQVVVEDGYHIIAENEREFRFFILFYYVATHTDESLAISRSKRVLSHLLAIHNLKVSFFGSNESWEMIFHSVLLGVNIIRQSNPKTALSLNVPQDKHHISITRHDLELVCELYQDATFQSVMEAIIEYMRITDFESHASDNSEQVIEIMTRYQQVTGIALNEKNKDEGTQWIGRIISLIDQISYNFSQSINGVFLLLHDFYHEYAMINPRIIENYERFVSIVSEVTRHDYKNYRELLFYWIVLNVGDSLFTPRIKVLFISRFADKHLDYLRKDVINLFNMMKTETDLVTAHVSEFEALSNRNHYDLILSDTTLETQDDVIYITFNNSILIADYLFDRINERIKDMRITGSKLQEE